ncbi:MAG: hypothetical protein ACHQ1H_01300, partial [Nitrososphaerales archaeon]
YVMTLHSVLTQKKRSTSLDFKCQSPIIRTSAFLILRRIVMIDLHRCFTVWIMICLRMQAMITGSRNVFRFSHLCFSVFVLVINVIFIGVIVEKIEEVIPPFITSPFGNIICTD